MLTIDADRDFVSVISFMIFGPQAGNRRDCVNS